MDSCYSHRYTFTDCYWDVWLWRTFPILLLFLGTFGNILNIIVLSRKRMQRHSTTVYLICLAIADMCTLWSVHFPFALLHGYGMDLRTTSQFNCKMNALLAYTFGTYSIWLVMLLTIERMLLTRFPVFSRSKLTRRFALSAALGSLGMITLLCVVLPFGYELNDVAIKSENGTTWHKTCGAINAEFESFFKTTWLLIVFVLFSLVPIALILVSNGVIIATIFLQRKRFQRVNATASVLRSNADRRAKSSTKVIILLSAFFIVTTLPRFLQKAFGPKSPPLDDQEQARRILTDSVLMLFMSLNYTFNFVLYCVCGSLFYDELMKCVKEAKHFLHVPMICSLNDTTNGDGVSGTGAITAKTVTVNVTRF